MSRLLPLLFLLGIAADLASIIWVGQAVGVIGTLLLLALDVVLGAMLLRWTGVSIAAALRQPIAAPQATQQLGIRAVLSVIAAIFLILPGFFSDFVAILLLLPPLQRLIGKSIRVQPLHENTAHGAARPERVTIIEGQAVEIDNEEAGPPRNP